jgi:hypothetical protein
MKKRCTPVSDIVQEWETVFKPRVLNCRSVPLTLVSEILDCTVDKVQEMLRSGLYSFGVARNGKYECSYDVYPLRFIAWYEGRMI